MTSQKRAFNSDKEYAFQFKITLMDTEPAIWRRVVVGNGSLEFFHYLIQTSMGWENAHLYLFEIGETLYGDPEFLEHFGDRIRSPEDVSLVELFLSETPPRTFTYTYDFGDDWVHRIQFEGIRKLHTGKSLPLCTDGARSCPPEDVGGIIGYDIFLEAINNPKHEMFEFYSGWEREFDPEDFSPENATDFMREICTETELR